MLKVENLTKKFNSGGSTVMAVNDISLAVGEGQFASIIGKSGSGKSTLLSLLGALDNPTSGSITVGERDITKLSGAALTRYRCSEIGFVFQGYNLVPNLSALENVLLPMEFAGSPKQGRKARAQELLAAVGITGDQERRLPGKLSGGQQQRVAIARALANSPHLILADEPTGNLDEATGKTIFDLLHKLSREQKTTIVVVTHDLSIAGKTDVTFRLQDGKLAKNK